MTFGSTPFTRTRLGATVGKAWSICMVDCPSSLPTRILIDSYCQSDADFGKAYLLEAWAARFVAALFRDYVVCFVGYSIDDPVLRYMTAAQSYS